MNINKYKLLEKILDNICKDAPKKYKMYKKSTQEEKNYARSRAYIHLFLMVKYGIFDFEKREKLLTDGSNDAGIDAYYIDEKNKIINIIQAKFRTNEKNFECKELEIKELRKMEINRVLDGEIESENGEKYCGKIKQFQDDISIDKLENRGRYKEKIIILANLNKLTEGDITKFFRITTEIFNYKRAYKELVFPLLKSEFFDADDLDIKLITQEDAGTKLKRYITTKEGTYVLTMMLIPIKEIGKVMNKYKNSLLQFNPRNYLSMKSGSVNSKIKKTIIEYPNTGEFALYNNGITIFSNECCVSEATGRKGTAVVTLKKPQIINGGQTAFTLSDLYEKYGESSEIFNNKEVVVKIISPEYDENTVITMDKHMKILKEISKATNNQNQIEESDMYSNDELQIELQNKFYEEYGLLYERKKGEFTQAIADGYLKDNQVIKRDELIKIYLSFKGEPSIKNKATKDIFAREGSINYDSLEQFQDIWMSYKIYSEIQKYKKDNKSMINNVEKIGYSLKYGTNAIIYAYKLKYSATNDFYDQDLILDRIKEILNIWKAFEKSTKEKEMLIYYKSKRVDSDIYTFFSPEQDKEDNN